MAQLKVRRGTAGHPLLLCGQRFANGDTIDSRDFPLTSAKWAQLAEHGFVELVDRPGHDARPARLDRIKSIYEPSEMSRDEIEAAIDEADLGVPCPSCDFVANTPHGLLVHTARKHKE